MNPNLKIRFTPVAGAVAGYCLAISAYEKNFTVAVQAAAKGEIVNFDELSKAATNVGASLAKVVDTVATLREETVTVEYDSFNLDFMAGIANQLRPMDIEAAKVFEDIIAKVKNAPPAVVIDGYLASFSQDLIALKRPVEELISSTENIVTLSADQTAGAFLCVVNSGGKSSPEHAIDKLQTGVEGIKPASRAMRHLFGTIDAMIGGSTYLGIRPVGDTTGKATSAEPATTA